LQTTIGKTSTNMQTFYKFYHNFYFFETDFHSFAMYTFLTSVVFHQNLEWNFTNNCYWSN